MRDIGHNHQPWSQPSSKYLCQSKTYYSEFKEVQTGNPTKQERILSSLLLLRKKKMGKKSCVARGWF